MLSNCARVCQRSGGGGGGRERGVAGVEVVEPGVEQRGARASPPSGLALLLLLPLVLAAGR